MRNHWHEIWASAKGPATGLAPETRIAMGVLLISVCLVSPMVSRMGLALIGTAALSWILFCRPPGFALGAAAVLSVAMFGPYLLLVPVIEGGTGGGLESWLKAAVVPVTILVRGMTCLLVSITTASTLSAGDVRSGVLRLRVPRVAALILIQILHQSATLYYETRRITAAIAVRGASRSGFAALRLLATLPTVWLPRIMARAERVGCAMEVRGYARSDLDRSDGESLRTRDGLAFAAASVLLAVAVWGRISGAS